MTRCIPALSWFNKRRQDSDQPIPSSTVAMESKLLPVYEVDDKSAFAAYKVNLSGLFVVAFYGKVRYLTIYFSIRISLPRRKNMLNQSKTPVSIGESLQHRSLIGLLHLRMFNKAAFWKVLWPGSPMEN